MGMCLVHGVDVDVVMGLLLCLPMLALLTGTSSTSTGPLDPRMYADGCVDEVILWSIVWGKGGV